MYYSLFPLSDINKFSLFYCHLVIIITELSDKIMEIGKDILGTYPVHHIVENAHSHVLTKDFAEMFARLYDIGNRFIALKDSSGANKLSDVPFNSPDYNSHLALSIIEHDLRNSMTGFSFDEILARTSDFDLKSKYIIDIEFDSEHIFAYENVRICLSMIPYVVSGDLRFLSKVRRKHVADLLNNLHYEPQPISVFNTDRVHIASDEYFCIHQLVKNAKKNILKMNKDDKTLNYFPAVHIVSAREHGHPYISVKDYGTGIGYDKLQKIFGGFTDTEGGTGIGLQLVKRLVELKDASGVVISKISADKSWGYCIRTKNIREMSLRPRPNRAYQPQSGTLFKLYFSEI
jgi:hypothetical protein